MSTRVFGLLLLGVALLPSRPAAAAPAGDSCSHTGTALYFGNGIMTTYDEARFLWAGEPGTVAASSCARIGSSNDVVCVVDLTGSGYDWKVLLGGPAYVAVPTAIDDMGREVHVTSTTLAGGDACGRTLVQNVSTEARFRFNGVNSEAKSFALLTLPIVASTTQASPLEDNLMFRDVSLE